MQDPDIDAGMFVFLTKENCPSCQAFKRQETVRSALSNGEAVELMPDDDGYEYVREQAGIEVLPGVVEVTADDYVAIGGE